MSENYSNSIENRAKILSDVLFREDIFGKDAENLKKSGCENVGSIKDRIIDNIDIAMALTNNYGKISSESGIVQSVLGTAIETAGLEKPWFMQRDMEKMITTYGEFVRGRQFDEMFGSEGYKKIFTGDYQGLLDDLKNYGASSEEILEFEMALKRSVEDGTYTSKDATFVSEMSYKVSKGRKAYEENPALRPSNIDKNTGFEKGSEDYDNYYFSYTPKKTL